MPLSNSRLAALAALLIALAPLGASAQDDPAKAAAEAEKQKKDIQKQLAGGTEVQKRLRVDEFKAANGQVKITGAFLEPPAAKVDDPPTFKQLQDEVEKLLRERLKTPALKLDWSGVTTFKVETHPHVTLQQAANAAGAKGEAAADRCKFDGSRYDADGRLVVYGTRGKDEAAAKWLAGAMTAHVAKHKAVRVVGGKAQVADEVKPVEWKLAAAEVRKVMSAAPQPSTRRLRVDRAYLAYDEAAPAEARWNTLYLTLEGVRLGEEAVDDEAIRAMCRKQWPELFEGTPRVLVNVRPLLGPGVAEPVARMRELVANRGTLDGVRVDPGAEFGPTGELMLAGLQPGLTAAQEKELTEVYRAAVKEFIDKADAASERYKRLAAGGVSARRMKLVQTGKLLAEVRAWAADTIDDALLSRLFFAADGGLRLQCKTVNKGDGEKVQIKFKELAARYLPAEPKPEPAPKQPRVPEPTTEATTFPASLTAHIRKEMAGDQKKWNGVLVERGYFDAANRYTIRGVVDTPAQNDALGKLLDELKADSRWADYFSPPPNKPALDVIPMSELLDRVRRVTPAYPEFDGVRVVTARYDANVNLIFDAHTAGAIDPAAGPLLAKLLRDHPTYKRRAPADKQVILVRAAGVPFPDDQVANFSLGYGAKLLADGNMDKAREWLDVGLLHFPNESGVWFLDAYYHHLKGDKELVIRDLDRMIDVEGPLMFNGPSQRKRRYEAAKDLQGKKRSELEALWLERFREVKDGARPMTMTLGK